MTVVMLQKNMLWKLWFIPADTSIQHCPWFLCCLFCALFGHCFKNRHWSYSRQCQLTFRYLFCAIRLLRNNSALIKYYSFIDEWDRGTNCLDFILECITLHKKCQEFLVCFIVVDVNFLVLSLAKITSLDNSVNRHVPSPQICFRCISWYFAFYD